MKKDNYDQDSDDKDNNDKDNDDKDNDNKDDDNKDNDSEDKGKEDKNTKDNDTKKMTLQKTAMKKTTTSILRGLNLELLSCCCPIFDNYGKNWFLQQTISLSVIQGDFFTGTPLRSLSMLNLG